MTDLSTAYQNAAFIPGGDAFPGRWAAAAAEFRALIPPQTLGWGPGERQVVDLFVPDDRPRGLMVFVHGGYWQAFHPRDFSHLAAGALARGWACALPAYDLCPAVGIGDITRQVARAVDLAAGRVGGPVVLTGHSAGGHLVARMACADAAPLALGRVRRVVPISPLGNLVPLLRTDLNAVLHLDAAGAAAESPVLHPRPGVPVHVWVGGHERPAFRDQARWLSRAWGAALTEDPHRHHFDVIDGLTRADSPLMRALLA